MPYTRTGTPLRYIPAGDDHVRQSNMNLNKVPDQNTDSISSIVQMQLKRIADKDILLGLESFLIVPMKELRIWEWHEPFNKYPIWVVAGSQNYDYGIAYSDYGFAPENPWGLIFQSHDNFDTDNCWYSSLEEAYLDSRLLEEYRENAEPGV